MLVRWTSTVRWVMKSLCAISRLVGPSAAISAMRRSLSVSAATPLNATRRGAADRRQLERMSKLIAGLGAAVSSAQRRPQLHARLRVLELRRGSAQDLHRFLEQSEPAFAAFDQTGCAEGGAKCPRGTPRARELDLFLRKRAGLVPPAELKQSQRGGRAPRDEGGVPAADLLEQASRLEHLLEAPGEVSAQQAQAPGAVAEEEQARAAR